MAPEPIQSCVGAIANRGQQEQGCSLYMATDLGPVRATRKKKYFTIAGCNTQTNWWVPKIGLSNVEFTCFYMLIERPHMCWLILAMLSS